jgi:hypothetical protein
MEKITKEYCAGKTVLFHPKSKEEATFIYRRLSELGIRSVPIASQFEKFLKFGMYAQEGRLYFCSSHEPPKNAVFCTSEQFDPSFIDHQVDLVSNGLAGSNMSWSEKDAMLLMFGTMLKNFNQLSARIDTLTEDIALIKAEVLPKHLSKDRLERK